MSRPTTRRWFHLPLRFVAFLAIVGALFTASLLAGRAGLYSSGTRRLNRDLRNPATQLAAVGRLADEFAQSFADDQPTIPTTRGQQSCPATYAAKASTLIGALTPTDATETMDSAASQLTAAGWRVDRGGLTARAPVVTARNRAGVIVVVQEQIGAELSTVEVTVTAPCPASPTALPPGAAS